MLRLDFFDRVKDEAVRAGDKAGCFDVPCGDILASDRLRKMILDESSEEWSYTVSRNVNSPSSIKTPRGGW